MATFRLNASGVSSPPIGSPGGTVLNHVVSRDLLSSSRCRRICTWNVRTLLQAGKLQNAIKEMDRLNIEILGISEMRWSGAGVSNVEKYRVYFSGRTDGRHEHGVGMVVAESIARHVVNFVPIDERIMLLQIDARPVKINILQVYAPTTDYSDDVVKAFYKEIHRVIKGLPAHELLIVMGDFNAKIGCGIAGSHVGAYGLGERNERGEMLNMFALENNLVVLNTFYKLPPRRLYTWKSPRDNEDLVVRNQIDYMMVNQRYRNSFISVKTYPGADIGSDHNPLVGKFCVRLKKLKKKGRYEI